MELNRFQEIIKPVEIEKLEDQVYLVDLGKNLTGSVTISFPDLPKGHEVIMQYSDFIYAKNWASYNDYGKILSKDMSWTVNEEKMALTNHAKFMHCLPVRRNVVVSDGVIDSENSIVVEQAYNREVTAQAVLKMILENV